LTCPALAWIGPHGFEAWFWQRTPSKKAVNAWSGLPPIIHPGVQAWDSADDIGSKMLLGEMIMSAGAWTMAVDPLVGIENYAMSASGMITHIAEGLFALKSMIWKSNIKPVMVSPTHAKKVWTGSGRAKKPEMVQALLDKTGQDLCQAFGAKPSNPGSPASDIADAVAIAWTILEEG
jgi:hypothetical protein